MKLHFGHLLAVAALFIAGCAAFFSVYGIGMLFSGAMLAVIIMGSSLELGKLVAASYLQRYWTKTNFFLRSYLIIAITILMAITSGGIYGFLSSAYQETFQKLAVSENEISFLKQKEKFYADDVARYDKELDRISNNISELSNTKANSIQVRDTTSNTGFRNTISTSGLRLAQDRINAEEENRKDMMSKRSVVSDSLQKYQLAILDKQNNNSSSSELGPLIYVANLTGLPMDKVVNYFILIFIIVFDPLAVTLVIATNRVFALKSTRKDDEPTDTITTSTGEVFNAVKEKVEVEPDPKLVTKPEVKTETTNKKIQNMLTFKNPFKTKSAMKIEPVNTEVKLVNTEVKPVNTEADPVNIEAKIEVIPEVIPEVIKSGVINSQGIVSKKLAPAPPPPPEPTSKTQITSIKPEGIKREDIKEIRENQNKKKNRGFSRNIPVRRGY